jgi:hypothetical protein
MAPLALSSATARGRKEESPPLLCSLTPPPSIYFYTGRRLLSHTSKEETISASLSLSCDCYSTGGVGHQHSRELYLAMLTSLRYLAGTAGPSGFGSRTTAEEATADCADITAIITGMYARLPSMYICNYACMPVQSC